MELVIILLTIISTSIAVSAYYHNKRQTALEKKSKVLELHGRNVIELEKLMMDIDRYASSYGIADEPFMEGLTYRESIAVLQKSRLQLMEIKKVILDDGEKAPLDMLEDNIQRLSDNLIQFDYIRNRLPMQSSDR